MKGCVVNFSYPSLLSPFLSFGCRLVEMHSSTVLVLVALSAVFSVAHPIKHIGHGHRITKVKVRNNEDDCEPPVVDNSGTPLLASTPTPVPSDVAESGPEPSSTSKVEPSPTVKPSSPDPTSTKDDGEDDKPTPTPTASGGSSLTDKMFPYGFGKEFWTTTEGIEGARPLSDATLKPTKVLNALSRDVVKAPDGKLGMKAHYPKGSYTFTHDPQGGFSFYAKGPSDVDLSAALEATFGYSVFFTCNQI